MLRLLLIGAVSGLVSGAVTSRVTLWWYFRKAERVLAAFNAKIAARRAERASEYGVRPPGGIDRDG